MIFVVIAIMLCCIGVQAESVYPLRPDDPQAVYLTAEDFGAHADGMADDSDAL